MRITKHQISNYKKNGIIKINSIITKKDCDDIIGFIKKIFIQYLKTKKINFDKNENFEKILFFTKKKFPIEYGNIILKTIQRNPNVLKIGLKKEIFLILKKMGLKEPVFSTEPLIMIHSNKITEKNYAPPHQDWRSIQGSLNGIITWTALVDVLEDNIGPLEIIPNSHKWGLLKTKKDQWYRTIDDPRVCDSAFVPIPMKQGDCLFFSSFLVHRSGKHNGKNSRYSLQFRFNDVNEQRFIQKGYPSTYPSDVPQIDYVSETNNPSVSDLKQVFN